MPFDHNPDALRVKIEKLRQDLRKEPSSHDQRLWAPVPDILDGLLDMISVAKVDIERLHTVQEAR